MRQWVSRKRVVFQLRQSCFAKEAFVMFIKLMQVKPAFKLMPRMDTLIVL